MEKELYANGISVKIEREALEIACGALRLRATDLFDGEEWLRSARDWRAFEHNDLCCARFNVSAQTARGACAGEYLLALSPKSRALLIATRLSPDDASKPELPFSWLHFNVSGVRTVRTLDPNWSAKVEDIKIATAFRSDVSLETENGVVGIFHAGEPIFDPKNAIVKPDMWFDTVGLTGFQPVHTAVLAFADDINGIEEARLTADQLYKEAEGLLASEEPDYEGEAYSFACGSIGFTLTQGAHGVALTRTELMGEKANVRLPLSQLHLRDLDTEKEWTVDTLTGWETARVFRENGGARLQLSGIEGFPELALEIEVTLRDSRAEWTSHVLNGEQRLSVLTASYPPSPFAAKAASCFVPECSGWVVPDAMRNHFSRSGIYPRGWRFTMSYFAAYTPDGRGFYCGLHDPNGAFRTMNMETDPLRGQGLFFARAYAPGMSKGGNAFRLPGNIVWQAFEGDWYDATEIYKQFVYSSASWLPKVGPEGREDTPLWAKETPLWIMDWMPNTDNPMAEAIPTSLRKTGEEVPMEYWYEEPIKLQKALNVPIGYHVYNWHWIPFNNDYPYYLPAKKEFSRDLHRLKENNIRVMPYINARLWDTHDRGGEDWQFSKKAKAWATQDHTGKLFTEKYESHEPDGSNCELAAMCPSSAVWKCQMAEVLKGLFSDIGVDGVYMDQIAAAAPYPCEDKEHTHTAGGGSWWAEQYELLLRRARQIRGRDGILTTEDNAEVYAAAMDGFLSWVWTFENQVPAFPQIYAGYIIMFGRTTNGLKKGDAVFLKYETAEQLVFGGQLGWLNADVAERPTELDFLKKMAQLRYRYSPFFYKGEMLRPAALQTDQPNRVTTPMYFDTKLVETKPVLTGTWRLWDGTETVMFLINCENDQARFTATFSAEQAEIVEGGGKIESVSNDDGTLTIQGIIEPEDYLVLKLRGAR